MELSHLIDIPLASSYDYKQVRAISCVAFHPRASVMAIVSNTEQSNLELWHFSPDGSNMTFVHSLKGHTKWIKHVAFHQLLPIMATCSKDNTTILWQLSEDNLSGSIASVINGHTDGVNSVAFHPIKPLLVTANGETASGSVELWGFTPEGSSPTFLNTIEQIDWIVKYVEFHKKLPILSTTNYNRTSLWLMNPDNFSFTCIDSNVGGESHIDVVAFHPILPLIAIASVIYDPSRAYVKLWQFSDDGSEATLVNTLILSSMDYRANSLAFHPTKSVIAIGCFKGNTQLWVLSSDNTKAAVISDIIETNRYHQERITSIAFHNTLPLLTFSCAIDKVSLLNIENLNKKLRWNNPTPMLKFNKELVLSRLTPQSYNTVYNKTTSLSTDQMKQAITRQLPSSLAPPIPEYLKDRDSYDRFITEQFEQKRKEEGKGLLDDYYKYLEQRKESQGGRIHNKRKQSKNKNKKSFNNRRKSRRNRK